MLGLTPGSLVSCHPHTEGTRLNCRWHLGMPCGEARCPVPMSLAPPSGKAIVTFPVPKAIVSSAVPRVLQSRTDETAQPPIPPLPAGHHPPVSH